MNLERQSDLTSRLFEEGALSPEEERELGLALRESPEARRLLLSYFRLEGAILDQARAGLVSTPAPLRTPIPFRNRPAGRPPAFATWISGLAAAVALLGLLVFADHRPNSTPTARIARSGDPRPEVRSSTSDTFAPPDPAPVKSTPAETPGLVPKEFPAPLPNDSQAADPHPAAEHLPEPRSEEGASRPPDAVLTEMFLERVEGDVTLISAGTRTRLKAGDAVRAGGTLETGPGKSLAALSFPDGTRIETRPDTLLGDIRQKGATGKSGKSMVLQRGSLWADVRPQPPNHPLVISSPRGEARVVGTVFTLRMDPDPKGVFRLDVQEGKVLFVRTADGRGVEVGAGHSASLGQSADLVVLRSQEILQSFQDGRFPTSDYAGTRDTQLVERSPQTAFGGAKVLLAEAENPKERRKASWPLLRWDLSSVPVGSRLHAASVTLHVAEPSRGQAFYFFEPARSWSESEATWKLASAGNLWRFPGSLGAVERWSTPLGTLAPFQKGEYTTVLGDAGVALVQSWISVPASNLGLQVAGSSTGSGFHFHSREASTPEYRPRLTIVYTPKK